MDRNERHKHLAMLTLNFTSRVEKQINGPRAAKLARPSLAQWRLLALLALSPIGCGPAPDGSKPDPGASTKKGEAGSGAPGEGPKASKSPGQPRPSEQGPSESDAGQSNSPESSVRFDLGVIPDDSNAEPETDRLCKIDFLFVIDNSVSMAPEQQSLARSVPGFVATLSDSIGNADDFHIGVVSTDENYFNAEPCRTLGGLTVETIKGVDSKNKCGPYENGLHFMTRSDDIDTSFACAAKLGISGDKNERPMEAAITALSPALAKKGACNEGFLREDALLVLVIITDEEDSESGTDQGSKGTPQDWYKAIVAAKSNDPKRVVVLSLIGVPEPNQCDEFSKSEVGTRLATFTNKFDERGSVHDVCAPSYDDFFTDAVSIIDQACDDPPG